VRVLAHDMCSCRVFCVSYFVEFFVRENSCRIQRETRSGGLEVGTTHTGKKESPKKKIRADEKMERKGKEWYSAIATDVVFFSRLIDN
jgi:hypothetical protein